MRIVSRAEVTSFAHNTPALPVTVAVADSRVSPEAQQQLLADRIFIRETAANERLVDHDGPRHTLRVILIQITSLNERNPHGAEKAGTHYGPYRMRPLVRRRLRMTRDRKTVV